MTLPAVVAFPFRPVIGDSDSSPTACIKTRNVLAEAGSIPLEVFFFFFFFSLKMIVPVRGAIFFSEEKQ